MATEKAPAQSFHLVVIHAFGKYRRGDYISDKAEIDAILAGDNVRSVNKVQA